MHTSHETSQTGAAAFLSAVEVHDTGVPNTCLIQSRFDIAAFNSDLFAQNNVTLPANIARAVPKRQADFLAGRLTARAGFAQMNIASQTLDILPNRAPNWPQGTAGAISHSAGHCACLVAADDQMLCGVDVELTAQGDALAAIKKSCLIPQDIACLNVQTDLPKAQCATLFFSAKETIYKAFAPVVGGFFGFDCATVVDPPENGLLRCALTQDLHPMLKAGHRINVNYRIQGHRVMTWIIVPKP